LVFVLISCDQTTKTTKEFPELKLKEFKSRLMEAESGSYITSMTGTGVDLYLAWEKVESTSYKFFKVYRETDSKYMLIKDSIPITNQKVLIKLLPYEEELRFVLTIVDEEGGESPFSKSNEVTVWPTWGKPSKYGPETEVITRTSDRFTLSWTQTNGNPEINPFNPKVFDSLSVNISYYSTELERTITLLSTFKDYESFREYPYSDDHGQIGNDRFYTIVLDSILNRVTEKDIIYLDPKKEYSDNTTLKNVFSKQGVYYFFFYLYKNKYIYRTKTFQLNKTNES